MTCTAGVDSSGLGYCSMLSRRGTADRGLLEGARSPCGRLAGDPSDVRLQSPAHRLKTADSACQGSRPEKTPCLVACSTGAEGTRTMLDCHASGLSACAVSLTPLGSTLCTT